MGAAFGQGVSPDFPGWMNYMNMVLEDPVHRPSPRYWLVWPGTMLLLAGSFAEVFSNYKSIYSSLVVLFSPLIRKISRSQDVGVNDEDVIEEPCTPEEMVPTWMWAGGIGKL